MRKIDFQIKRFAVWFDYVTIVETDLLLEQGLRRLDPKFFMSPSPPPDLSTSTGVKIFNGSCSCEALFSHTFFKSNEKAADKQNKQRSV